MTGIFRYRGIRFLHFGQVDGGNTTDIPFGIL